MKPEKVKRSDNFDYKLADLARSSKRNAQFTKVLTGLFIVELVLFVVAASSLYTATQNSRRLARQNQTAIMLSCKAVNDANEAQLRLWGFVFELPSTADPDMSDEQKQQAEENRENFKTYINEVFKPNDCQ